MRTVITVDVDNIALERLKGERELSLYIEV